VQFATPIAISSLNCCQFPPPSPSFRRTLNKEDKQKSILPTTQVQMSLDTEKISSVQKEDVKVEVVKEKNKEENESPNLILPQIESPKVKEGKEEVVEPKILEQSEELVPLSGSDYVETEIPAMEEESAWEDDMFEELENEYDPYYDDEDYDYNDLAEEELMKYERKLWNPKRQSKTKRSTQSNKQAKTKKWISALKYSKRSEKTAFIAANQSAAKENSAKKRGGKPTFTFLFGQRRCEPYPATAATTHKNSTSSNRTPAQQQQQDDDMRRAISASISTTFTTEVGLSHSQLMDIMSRDLTPEDYETLLALDKTVAPKALKKAFVAQFPKKIWNDSSEERCPVCMMEYEKGETLMTLPCGHYFHLDCITTWLTSSSVNCPVDGLAVSDT